MTIVALIAVISLVLTALALGFMVGNALRK